MQDIREEILRQCLYRKKLAVDQKVPVTTEDNSFIRRTAHENKESFIENYGIKFELPSEYVIDAGIGKLNT